MQNGRDFFFQWHLTERCNLRCTHCYQNGHGGDELSSSEALAFIDEAAEALTSWNRLYGLSFAPAFNVTGGEPLLRQDLFVLLSELRQRGMAVRLLTNGTLVDRQAADRLQLAGVEAVQVSMEGGEMVHDAMRGRGSFQAAVAGVRNLVAAGLEVTLNMTISRHNAGSFDDLLSLAEETGARRLGFSRLVPSGRGRTLLCETLGLGGTKKVYQGISARQFSRSTRVQLVTGDPVAAQLQLEVDADGGEVPVGGCAAGVFGITVAADGTVMPCRRLPLVIGDIRSQSLRSIWASSEVLMQLRNRQAYGGKCRTCLRWAVCRGCRAIAHAFTGDYLAEDPHCFLC